MVTKEELDLLLAGLKADVARMKPTPLSMAMATDVFWAVDPAPVACSHGDTTGKCRLCYYESSTAFDEPMDDMHESRGHD